VEVAGFRLAGWVEDLVHGLDAHVAVLDLAFVTGLEQRGADEAYDGGLGWEYADDIGAALHLLVKAFQRVGAVQLGAVRCGAGNAM
jgi:hypothetical protein